MRSSGEATFARLTALCFAAGVVLLTEHNAQAQQGEVVPPKYYSESTAPNGDKEMTFYIEKPEECTGNGCNSSGSSEGGGGGGGGGGVSQPGVEPGNPTGAGIANMIAAPVLGAIQNLINSGLGNNGGRQRAMARAQAELEMMSDFLKSGKHQATEAATKKDISAHWSSGHFYSEQQLKTQAAKLEATAAKIRAGSIEEGDLSSLVQHAPATDSQVREAVQKQLGPLIGFYQRMAVVCGPDGMCDGQFGFNAAQYTDEYSNLAKSSEAPNFERYILAAESGVDTVFDAVSSRYADVAGSNSQEGDKPPLDVRGGILKALSDLGSQLQATKPSSRSGKAARREGLSAVSVGKNAARKGNFAEAEAAAKIAKGLLDVAIGAVPIVGFVRDVYEASVGEDALTGEKLSDDARLLSAISAMSAGVLSEAKNIGRVIEAISESKTLSKGLSKVEARAAEAVNNELKARYALSEPPYRPGTRVYRYETLAEERFVRVYTEGVGNKQGPWLLKGEHIKNLSPEQIATKYALPKTPTHMSEVIVPGGQILERGAANKKIFEGDPVVAYQYRLLDVADAVFKDGIPIPIP